MIERIKMRLKTILLLLVVPWCCTPCVSANTTIKRTLYVDAQNGSDLNDGSSGEKSWKTLIHASKEVQAGDHVLVAPGVYRGGIQLFAKGTSGAPIIFEGDGIEGSTIITLADSVIRGGIVTWQLEDRKTGLYSVDYTGGIPARVLYSGTDLYPYASEESLNTFRIKGTPGPKHGYYYDSAGGKLYVRLYPGGKYGPVNPNDHVMAVAPPTGSRFDGTLVSQPYHYGIGVLGPGDAHIIIDGFTFEVPGVAGVYTEANDVTIRNGWFQGCRTGVAGNYKDRTTTDPEGKDYFSLRYDPSVLDLSASRIVIEYCDYHQEPAFEDAVELMKEFANSTRDSHPDIEAFYKPFWHRKSVNHGLPGQTFGYEIGIAARIGSDWVIRRNHIHDTFEGLSCHAVSASRGLQVEYNIFERILDNAIETEDHSSNMHIYRNVIVDVFMPFSWQPIRGTPWPYSIFFTENIIYNTPENQNLWEDIGFRARGLFKIGVKMETWERVPHMVGTLYAPVTVPGSGLVLANNTILFPGGSLVTTQGGREMPVHNVNIINNIIDTEFLLSLKPDADLKENHFYFENNVVYFSALSDTGPARIVAGKSGKMLKTPNAASLDKHFMPVSGNNVYHPADSIPDVCRKYMYIGAIQPGDDWFPPEVGPAAEYPGYVREFTTAKDQLSK
jgi:hypothetical protein